MGSQKIHQLMSFNLSYPSTHVAAQSYMVEEILCDYGNAYGFKSTVMRNFDVAGCDTKGKIDE